MNNDRSNFVELAFVVAIFLFSLAEHFQFWLFYSCTVGFSFVYNLAVLLRERFCMY